MGRRISEDEISWSCIEKYIPYAKVVYSMHKNGISKYTFLNENGEKIDINDYIR